MNAVCAAGSGGGMEINMRKWMKAIAAAVLAAAVTGAALSAAASDGAGALEQSVSSIVTLAEMDVQANQAAILALLQGIAAQMEPGSPSRSPAMIRETGAFSCASAR